jgi:hypothetical protein
MVQRRASGGRAGSKYGATSEVWQLAARLDEHHLLETNGRMAYERTNPVASAGSFRQPGRSTPAWGITERVDGYCATSYIYSRRPQPVPRLDVAAAIADIGCWPHERPYPMEARGCPDRCGF